PTELPALPRDRSPGHRVAVGGAWKALPPSPPRPSLCRPRSPLGRGEVHTPRCPERNPRGSHRSRPPCSTRGLPRGSAPRPGGDPPEKDWRTERTPSWPPPGPWHRNPAWTTRGKALSAPVRDWDPRGRPSAARHALPGHRRLAVSPALPNTAARPREPREAMPEPRRLRRSR